MGRGLWPAVVLAAVLSVGASGAPGAKPDRTAPRIVRAVMLDVDNDARADRLLLTYSERIRHAVDGDGRFPFSVNGYRLRSVGAPKGKTLTLVLAEKGAADTTAKPPVRYRRTTSKPVRDRTGNQAANQTFRATRAHGHAPPLPGAPLDTTPPETELLSGPTGTTTGRDASFTYSSPESGAAFECALDGVAFAACAATGRSYAGLADGAHTFAVRARDAAGNVDASPASRTWSTDGDGDGSIAPADCAPDNAAISPAAADPPEMTFADTNCDGIDGTETGAIFVSPIGSDASPGSRALPMRTLAVAVATAAAQGKQVYSTFGTYTERLNVAGGVGVYGGYGTDWTRLLVNETRISGAASGGRTEGALALGVVASTTLQHLTLAPAQPGTDGASSYGLRAVSSPGLVLDHVVAIGAPGTAGNNGTAGLTGASGKAGAPGGQGSCDGPFPGDGGGLTGTRVGRQGGEGGRGAQRGLVINQDSKNGQAGAGTGGGAGGPRGFNGDPGAPGGTGVNGEAGSFQGDGAGGAVGQPGLAGGGSWDTRAGQAGRDGTDGFGGGGGGGGGGQSCAFCDDGSGNGGGEGGDGGAGGDGGGRGGGGGGSFGIYLVSSSGAVLRNSVATAGDGGHGGVGAIGRFGGAGGVGGAGGSTCTSEVGAGGKGGVGGGGARGGHGGGGSGGPSIALLRHDSVITGAGNVFAHGSGGSGGNGAGGTGAPGLAADEKEY